MSSLRRCPYFRNSLYTSLCSWEGVQCPYFRSIPLCISFLSAIATDPVIGAYELIGGSMDGFTPPEGVYSSPKDDESGMSHKEYLLTLNYQQVGVAGGCILWLA